MVARVCLDLLRSRNARREEPLGVHVPDPVVSRPEGIDPEQQALLADAVGVALLGRARDPDPGALLAALDPDVVLRADAGPAPSGLDSREVHGAPDVARLRELDLSALAD